MKYEAPTLKRFGSVAGVTASDIKCSPGTDMGYQNRWAHPNEEPFSHWTNVKSGAQATPGELLGSGRCEWVSNLIIR